MRSRCNCPTDNAYSAYGGRGIGYDPKWETWNGFWEDMEEGWFEGATIERKDVNQGYSKENCCWITQAEQTKSTRRNRMVMVNGTKMCMADFCRLYDLNYPMIRDRIYRGWNWEDALFTTAGRKGKPTKKILPPGWGEDIYLMF